MTVCVVVVAKHGYACYKASSTHRQCYSWTWFALTDQGPCSLTCKCLTQNLCFTGGSKTFQRINFGQIKPSVKVMLLLGEWRVEHVHYLIALLVKPVHSGSPSNLPQLRRKSPTCQLRKVDLLTFEPWLILVTRSHHSLHMWTPFLLSFLVLIKSRRSLIKLRFLYKMKAHATSSFSIGDIFSPLNSAHQIQPSSLYPWVSITPDRFTKVHNKRIH